MKACLVVIMSIRCVDNSILVLISSTVSDISPFASTAVTQRHVISGDYAILDPFPIDCYPAPTVQWFEGSSQTALRAGGTENYYVTLGNQLVVLGARAGIDNNKAWRVTATNGYTQQTMNGPTFVLRVSSKWAVNSSADVY